MSERAARVAALAGAVALVAVALVVRNRIDGGDGGSGETASPILCPPELVEACQRAVGGEAALVRVEAAPDTAARLTAAATAAEVDDAGLWLVPRPWAEAVADARARANAPRLTGEPAGPVARSPAVLLLWNDRAAALEAGICDGSIGWRCVGDAADRPWDEVGGEAGWGRVRAGLADPASATGLPVLGAAVAGYLERGDYATNDVDGGLSAWLGALAVTADQTAADDVVGRMLTRGPGELAALGTLEAQVAPAVAGRDDVRIVVPEPVVTADLVVVPVGEGGGDRSAAEDLAADGELRDALAEAGWRVPDRDPVGGVDPDVRLPDGDGLPDGAVVRPLLDRWLELA